MDVGLAAAAGGRSCAASERRPARASPSSRPTGPRRRAARCWPTPTPIPRRWRTTPTGPEFLVALLGRPARTIHFSDTLGENMMYVAIPVREDGRITTVVRDGHAAHPHERRPRRPVLAASPSAPWSWRVIAAAHRLLGLPAHQRPDARDQGGGRAVSRPATSRTSSSCRASEEFAGVAESLNRMAEELDDKIAHAHPPAQRARGGALEHGRGRAGGGHRRARHRRERAAARPAGR